MAPTMPRQPPATLREAFRFRKGRRIRIYGLHSRQDGSFELWVVSREGVRLLNAHRMVTFGPADEERLFLDDCERELRQGGWQRL